MEKIEKKKLIMIDSRYKARINQIKEKNKEDPESIINYLENKHILILAIQMALKNKLKPREAKIRDWIIRSEYLREEDHLLLGSLIFSYNKNLKILLPENYSLYHDLIENLANAGMEEILDLLEDKDEVETLLLKKINIRKKIKK